MDEPTNYELSLSLAAEESGALQMLLVYKCNRSRLLFVKSPESVRHPMSKGNIGKALGYAKNHLARLRHYLEDGRGEIDKNQIENKIRPLALGRKNYMFAGSNKGVQRAAMM